MKRFECRARRTEETRLLARSLLQQRGATRFADRENTTRGFAWQAETWTGDIMDFRRQQVVDVYLRARLQEITAPRRQ